MSFVASLSAAVIGYYYLEPLDEHGNHIRLPNSQLDWCVVAAREHYRCGDDVASSTEEYAQTRDDLTFSVRFTGGGRVGTHIASTRYQRDVLGKGLYAEST